MLVYGKPLLEHIYYTLAVAKRKSTPLGVDYVELGRGNRRRGRRLRKFCGLAPNSIASGRNSASVPLGGCALVCEIVQAPALVSRLANLGTLL
jgi:hypothetical protein